MKGKKLTEEDVALIRALYKERQETLSVRQIANKFQVDESHISKICRGEKWKHVK